VTSQMISVVSHIFKYLLCFVIIVSVHASPCDQLLIGQYVCDRPVINNATQEIDGCSVHGNATIRCWPHPDLQCTGPFDSESNRTYFEKYVACRYTNGYSYQVAVLLSVFLGWPRAKWFFFRHSTIWLP